MRPPALRLQTEVVGKNESIEEMLSRHGLADDSKTREMLRSLNPKYNFSQGVITSGTKIDLFTVTGGSEKVGERKYTFDTPNVARMAFFVQASEAAEVRKTTLKLPANAYADPALTKVHSQAVYDIQRAAETLQGRADSLSRRDYTVAQYQLEYANRQAAALNLKAQKARLTEGEVMKVSASARDALALGQRIASEKLPISWRPLKVNVFNGRTSVHAGPLQVYVIPSGAIDMPEIWTRNQLESFLNDFSFVKDASPTSQDVADFDARICIGPKNAIAGMVKLISERKLTTCKKAPDFSFPSSAAFELTFRSPDDLARP